MKTTAITLLITLAALAMGNSAARADTFGSGADTFMVDFTAIGNPNNPADTAGPVPAGAVAYSYRIGTCEVSEDMVTKASALGSLGIVVQGRGVNKPMTVVTWNGAARFVNWLNTSSGRSAAYNFQFQPGEVGYNSNDNVLLWADGDVGYDAANPYRNANAFYFLPTTDEWYKAAYYDAATGGYTIYPTGSDAVPVAVESGTTAGTAVYLQPFATGPADITNAGGLSPYGTMGQGGNVWEWNESAYYAGPPSPGSDRVFRGGSWDGAFDSDLQSSFRDHTYPTYAIYDLGFRVASVPEPSALGLMLLAGAVAWRAQRRGKPL